jgi:hypothetical protein
MTPEGTSTHWLRRACSQDLQHRVVPGSSGEETRATLELVS